MVDPNSNRNTILNVLRRVIFILSFGYGGKRLGKYYFKYKQERSDKLTALDFETFMNNLRINLTNKKLDLHDLKKERLDTVKEIKEEVKKIEDQV